MSDKALKWARERMRGGDVSGGLPARAVLLLMAYEADRDHQLSPTVGTIAAQLGCDERTVQRAIANLVRDKLIERELRSPASSLYRLSVEP